MEVRGEKKENIKKQIQNGIVTLCEQTLENTDIEIDAIVAVTIPNTNQEIVIKLHKQNGNKKQFSNGNQNSNNSNSNSLPKEESPSADITVVSLFPEMFICGVCNYEMLCKEEILDHVKTNHNYKKTYTCLPCGYYYPALNLFKHHRLSAHHEPMHSVCSVCRLSFSAEEVNLHKLECTTSEEMVIARDNLPTKNFMQTFSREQRKRVKNLATKKSHLGLKSFRNLKISAASSRPLADKMSSTVLKGRVETNMRVDVDGEFTCTVCETVVCGMDEFQEHSMEEHRKHVCTYCARTFVSSRNLWRHLVLHGAKPPYRCDKCRFNYHKEINYLRHLQLKHAYD